MMLAEQVPGLSSKSFGSQWAPARFLEDYGAGLTRMPDSAEFDFRHEASGTRIELKAARRNSKDNFCFQYIRPDCFDLCVCLGWQSTSHNYWVFTTKDIVPLLTKQHRAFGSFQLRLRAGTESINSLAVSPDRLRVHLDSAVRLAIRHRKPVRLDPILAAVEGWPSVASSICRSLKQFGLSDDWQFVLRPLREQPDEYEPGLLPYPEFFHIERRIELQVHPEPVVGTQQVRVVAGCLFDFLVQFLDRDDAEDEDAV